MDEETSGLFTLETMRKTGIHFDRRSLVGYCLEKSPWLKAGQVERDDRMQHGRPPNLEVSSSAEITRMAGIGWINQTSTKLQFCSAGNGFNGGRGGSGSGPAG